ncbi:histone-fold-containing protein [Microstroma glucosiphilum]|uniref:DNA polymerase epsilon subunit D n=1 Tax=Pseudomicrostroma glucosiphilum TaxID=1684307 RepID=A0A316UGN6_9BASI|nr:histone-fold-containing protein [Pseudomicrostroma glucosiphilum]PWN23093.1 histone-fold-containing protein [Pseudomicrostroma glucosiphilum]
MPRKKAQPALAANGGPSSPSSMTPMDSAAADETIGESSFVSQAAVGAGVTPQQRGGVITESMQKQMGGPEGIDQFELPRAVVTRVAKAELPDSVQIRKDAILAVSKSATIFISYLAAVADEIAKQDSRKTISTQDVLEGLALMEFPAEVQSKLKAELKAYRSSQEQTKREKAEAAASGSALPAGAGGEDGEEEEDDEEEAVMADAADGEEQTSMMLGEGEERPRAQPAGEQDVDEEDEDTEQRMAEEGADEGEEEDEEMGDEEG